MPTLTRVLLAILLLGAAAYGALYALTLVEPKIHPITFTVSTDRLAKPAEESAR